MLVRSLVAFGLVAAALASWAAPAAARQDPRFVPGRVENWVEVGRDVQGGTSWFNSEFIVSETYYRAARFRFDRPGEASAFFWLQFDCDGGAVRLIDRVDLQGIGHTAIPASSWLYYDEGEVVQGTQLVASAAREKLCNWGK